MYMKKTIRMINSKIGTYTVKETYVKFPRYLEAMDAIGNRLALEKENKKKMKEEKVSAQNLMEKTTPTPMDPLSAINIRVNVRTGSKTNGLCCRQCHLKIHKELYDGIALSDLHNPEVAY